MQPHPDLSPVPDLDEDLIVGLDSFIADHIHPEAGTLSRNDAVNRILRDWLTGQGYVAPMPKRWNCQTKDGPSRIFTQKSHRTDETEWVVQR